VNESVQQQKGVTHFSHCLLRDFPQELAVSYSNFIIQNCIDASEEMYVIPHSG
jgi:hypothetical protein